MKTKWTQKRETLRRYESYRFDGNQFEDLSGALIQSNKPIAVISGVHAKVPNHSSGNGDWLVVQVPPTNMWGTQFSIVPSQNLDLNSNYVYRVQTKNISTNLTLVLPRGRGWLPPPSRIFPYRPNKTKKKVTKAI